MSDWEYAEVMDICFILVWTYGTDTTSGSQMKYRKSNYDISIDLRLHHLPNYQIQKAVVNISIDICLHYLSNDVS